MGKPIGVFDSGIGGLTVVRELMRYLPHESIVYFGDTARVPYGGKSAEIIQKFADQIVRFLISKDVELIVIACNTASAIALDWLKNQYPIPIVGVIKAGAKMAVKSTSNNRVGIIGTRATIRSRAYITAINKLHPGIKVYSKSCPLLVPLVEESSESTVVQLILTQYLTDFKKKNIDTLILGCTHYPLIKNNIQTVIGEDVKLIDSASAVAYEVRSILKRSLTKSAQTAKEKPQYLFYFSDIPQGFKQLSKRFLGSPIPYIKITLE